MRLTLRSPFAFSRVFENLNLDPFYKDVYTRFRRQISTEIRFNVDIVSLYKLH